MFCCIRPFTSLFVKRCQVISLIYNFFCVMTFYKYLISVGRWLSSFTVYDSNFNPVLHNKIIELPRQQRHRCVKWNYPHPLQAAAVRNSKVLIWIRIRGLRIRIRIKIPLFTSVAFKMQTKIIFLSDKKLIRSDTTNFLLVYGRIRIQSRIHQAALTPTLWRHYFHYLKESYRTVTFLTLSIL
jgi:hypothetical protein